MGMSMGGCGPEVEECTAVRRPVQAGLMQPLRIKPRKEHVAWAACSASRPHSFRDSRHAPRWTSKFTKKLVTIGLDGRRGPVPGVFCALCGLVAGHGGMGVCESFATPLRNKTAIAKKLPSRQFSGIQQVLDDGELGDFFGFRVWTSRRMVSWR